MTGDVTYRISALLPTCYNAPYKIVDYLRLFSIFHTFSDLR